MSTTVDKRRHSTEVVDLTHDDSDGDLAADQYLLPLDIALPFLRTQVQSHSLGVLLPRAGRSPRGANQKMLTVKREARARDEVDILRCRLLQEGNLKVKEKEKAQTFLQVPARRR